MSEIKVFFMHPTLDIGGPFVAKKIFSKLYIQNQGAGPSKSVHLTAKSCTSVTGCTVNFKHWPVIKIH